MIKAIFFDFDLTLVDTGNIGREIYNKFSKHAGLKPTEKGFEAYMGQRLSEGLDVFAKNEKDRKNLLKIFLRTHDERMDKIRVYSREILKYLKNKKIKVIVISNTSKQVIKKVCRVKGIHFNVTIGDEDMGGCEKKHQAIKRTMKKIGLTKKEVYYVGDHINDIREGKKAGVKVISVTTGVYSESQLKRYKPYRIINNLNELKYLL